MADKDRSASIHDLHREVSLAVLKSSSCYCVRTPRGQKDPGHLGWEPKANSPEVHRQNLARLERNDDNLGIHLFGNFIDVDVDTDNPTLLSALDYFLPPTPHTWGRGERKRTHRLYELSGLTTKDFEHANYPFLSVVAKHEDLKLEIRGGELRAGRYSLLPGSLHPSGDIYQWHDVSAARSTPVAVDVNKVMDAVRFALVVAALAPYWTEGVRNDLCMALSGFMHRAAMHVEDMGAQSTLYFTKVEAQRILEGLMDVADDDEADQQMRMRTFEQTWEKAEKGEAVTGATTIAKLTGQEDLIHLLYVLLADTPDLVALDRFFDRYAVRNNTSTVVDLELAGSRNAVYLMSVQDFRNSNLHRSITSGTGARVQMSNVLLASPRAIRVDGFTFRPHEDRIVEDHEHAFVNNWRGYAIQPADECEAEEVAPFLQYVQDILADGNEVYYKWIMAWLADLFQFPGDKSGTALVLVGRPGSGKSILGEAIIRKIIGKNHSMQTNTLESITGQFNADSSSMLFVQCDEAANTRRRVDANKLKSMITDRTRRVEPKGVDAFQIEDCARYLFTSNEINDAVAIVDGRYDRRYTVFHVSEKYAYRSKQLAELEVRKYWDTFGAWCADTNNLAKIHRYLSDYVYDRKLIRSALETKAKQNLQQHSMRGFDEWLAQLAMAEHPFDTTPKGVGELHESYVITKGRWESSVEQWPDAVSYPVLVESYNYYRRKNGITASTPNYNVQQLRNEFIRRNLLAEDAESKIVRFTKEEWVNERPRTSVRKLRVTMIPTREKIRAYVEDIMGLHADEFDTGYVDEEVKVKIEREEF